MGSPMVFQTAPPQPASNARMTCSPQLVGGAEASQNGLGDRMPPANVVERSDRSHLEGSGDSQSGPLSIRHGIHHLAAAIDAVAACKILRTPRALQECIYRRLSDGGNHHVARQLKIGAGAKALQRDDAARCRIRVNGHWLSPPFK